eukprot:CAMPEP_0197542950 /NCGR_PEP_ID=MMETSP1318-20131121/67977_1 /TAXON_ID=552666 /ORGANISM="Partenskyella glossopodia, Strain RCC365" /LENGTH=43 /DNA_ID= /DNA_START= /DNA_END= /DNA_ORIENTATION=
MGMSSSAESVGSDVVDKNDDFLDLMVLSLSSPPPPAAADDDGA